mmetsp:Transcript_24183/g.40039  ORF Transcript_24183/g.40039 Transcript_24183/m.40039 type:complete len:83 (-) Transcript_24183:235-483(-)
MFAEHVGSCSSTLLASDSSSFIGREFMVPLNSSTHFSRSWLAPVYDVLSADAYAADWAGYFAVLSRLFMSLRRLHKQIVLRE